jgi:YkoY family integral membrane protein
MAAMLWPLYAYLELFGQRLEWQDLAVVALLVVLEGMLSIDNALVLGLLAKRLPRHEQSKALWYGLAGAFVFRFTAVLLASLLLRWTFAKFLGGAYLVYIAAKHLWFEPKEEKPPLALDAQGRPVLEEQSDARRASARIEEHPPAVLTPEMRAQLGLARFWPTVCVIELTDIAFAVDSILAAIAMVGSPPKGTPPDAWHPKLWVIVLGGVLGLMLMRVAARLFIQLLERFPRFEVSAYLLVIVIGLKLLADWGFNSDWSFDQPPWAARTLGSWKQPLERFEARRRQWVEGYEHWLKERWPLGLVEHHPPGGGDEASPDHAPVPHVPHLLDFHSPRRPEFLLFWALMVACFSLGFFPPRPRPRPS